MNYHQAIIEEQRRGPWLGTHRAWVPRPRRWCAACDTLDGMDPYPRGLAWPWLWRERGRSGYYRDRSDAYAIYRPCPACNGRDRIPDGYEAMTAQDVAVWMLGPLGLKL